MGDGFRGVSSDQDGRFKSAEKKLFAKMKFPPQFATKVDMRKVRSACASTFPCIGARAAAGSPAGRHQGGTCPGRAQMPESPVGARATLNPTPQTPNPNPTPYTLNPKPLQVHLDVLRPWVTKKVTTYVGSDDDILINMVMAELEKVRRPAIAPSRPAPIPSPARAKSVRRFAPAASAALAPSGDGTEEREGGRESEGERKVHGYTH